MELGNPKRGSILLYTTQNISLYNTKNNLPAKLCAALLNSNPYHIELDP